MDKSPIIVALDNHRLDDALAMVAHLDPALCRVKVGKELFTSAGPAAVTALQGLGFEVFLDLKFHDIPNTTAQAVLAAADLGVWMVNVHASGGARMMQECASRLQAGGYHTQLIAVTVLTSMQQDDLTDIGCTLSPAAQVQRLALLAKTAGMHGVVCSAQEAAMLRAQLGSNFTLVTPGIRPAGSDSNDQKRIVTPQQAMRNGSSYLVIGRPITQAANPGLALGQIIASLL